MPLVSYLERRRPHEIHPTPSDLQQTRAYSPQQTDVLMDDPTTGLRPSDGALSLAGVLDQHLTRQQFLGQGESQSQWT